MIKEHSHACTGTAWTTFNMVNVMMKMKRHTAHCKEANRDWLVFIGLDDKWTLASANNLNENAIVCRRKDELNCSRSACHVGIHVFCIFVLWFHRHIVFFACFFFLYLFELLHRFRHFRWNSFDESKSVMHLH